MAIRATATDGNWANWSSACRKYRGKLYYEYRYGAMGEGEADSQWGEPLVTTSSVGNVVASVAPLLRYYAQTRACNGHGKSEWSEPVSCIAL